MNEILEHPFSPIFDENSRILILGTFPSVKSREDCFYYGNPQNRFWKVISAVTKEQLPSGIAGKTELLLKTHISVWDVLKSCRIKGSSDITIKDELPNDFSALFNASHIKAIFTNGNTAYKLFLKHIGDRHNLPINCLPSTSPANAKFRLDDLVRAWSCILTYI